MQNKHGIFSIVFHPVGSEVVRRVSHLLHTRCGTFNDIDRDTGSTAVFLKHNTLWRPFYLQPTESLRGRHHLYSACQEYNQGEETWRWKPVFLK